MITSKKFICSHVLHILFVCDAYVVINVITVLIWHQVYVGVFSVYANNKQLYPDLHTTVSDGAP